jgi:hypothetical protein
MQFADPVRDYALDMFLPKGEAIVVTGGKIADVQMSHRESPDLGDLPLGQEPVGDAALIKDLDGTCAEPTSTRAGQGLIRTPLNYGDIDARQSQFTRQHQPCRTCADDDYRMFGC